MDKKLNKLYQSTILEHGHQPKNFGKLDKFDKFAEGFNPLCGDKVNIYCKYNFNLKLVDMEGFEPSCRATEEMPYA